MIGPIELLIAGAIAFLLRERLLKVIEEIGRSVESFMMRYRDPVQWRRHLARLQLMRQERAQTSIEDLRFMACLLVAFLLLLELMEL